MLTNHYPSETEIKINAFEEHLKELLINEVKSHLHKLVDEEIENIARDSVVKFLDIKISTQKDMMSMGDSYLFSFVQNCTKTIIKEKVVQELKRS